MTLPLGLVLALTLMTQGERPHMSVVLCDQIGIDALTWSTAKTEAIRVFDDAGIHVEWVDLDHGNKPCIPPPMGAHFLVILSPTPPKDWIGPDAMGFAPAHTNRAYVFHDRVKRFMQRFGQDENEKSTTGIVVGHAIAHELGHLLIPGDAHGEGLMRPVWSYREWTRLLEGTLRFNPDHATVIQDQLRKVGTAAKTQLQSADSEPEPAHESRSVASSRKDL